MSNQYPHSISIIYGDDPSQNEESGNFQPDAEPGTTFQSECRAEPAGSNPVVTGIDGNQLVFSWIAYMPKTELEFSFGDKVTITMQNGSQYNGTVKRQYNGKFNTRVWV